MDNGWAGAKEAARRQVASNNACVEIPTDSLEAGVVGMMSEFFLGWDAPELSKEDNLIEVNRRRQEIQGWLELGAGEKQEEAR